MKSAKQRLTSLTLIPSKGGCFEVTIDGELIYSKLSTGIFPDEAVMLDTMTDRMRSPTPRSGESGAVATMPL
ncbi:hypothetical protein BH11PLA2_BH11PLA2_15190 [soil metagenome]